MNDQQQIQQSWNFIGQMARDFIGTLPPSVAEAMGSAVNYHFAVVAPVVLSAAAPADDLNKETE